MPRTNLGQVSLSPKGTWDAKASYRRLDVVTSDGSAYVATAAATAGTKPPASPWSLLVERGGRFSDLTEDEKAALAKPATDAAAKANVAAERAEAAVESITRQAKLYGVRFDGPSATGVRLYDAVGRQATPTVGAKAGSSDFDGLAPFDFVRVKRSRDSSGAWRDVAVEGTPGWDSAEGDVFCRFRNLYFLHTDDGTADTRVVSVAPFAGAHPLLTDDDGNMPEFLYIPAYMTTFDPTSGASQSRPGRYPGWGGYGTFAKADKLAGERCHSGVAWFETWKLLLPVIEYANRDVQAAIGQGFSAGVAFDVACKAVAAATATNKVRVPASYVGRFAVGMGAMVGLDSYSPATSPRIKADERTITAVDSATGELTLDGKPFDVTTDDLVSALDWKCGSCDSMAGHTGQPVADALHPVKYRGIEGIWGGAAEPLIDIRLKTVTGDDGAKRYETWYCPDPVKARDCTSDGPNADFLSVGLPWPTSPGYISRSQRSEAYPILCVPATATGATSTTYYADYYWFTSDFPDNRAPRSGNHWADGGNLGALYRPASFSASSSNRYCCARLFIQP